MSFPGGRFDPSRDKNLQETAFRETYEEIGVSSRQLNIIGKLDDLPTLTGFIIRPYIAVIRNPDRLKFKIDSREVKELIEIPIDYIIKENLFYKIPFPRDPKNWEMLCFDYKNPTSNQEYKVWGATAHMLQEFLKKIYNLIVISPEYIRPNLKDCIDFIEKSKIRK